MRTSLSLARIFGFGALPSGRLATVGATRDFCRRLLVVCCCLSMPALQAQAGGEEEISQLHARIAALEARLAQLEAHLDAGEEVAPAAPSFQTNPQADTIRPAQTRKRPAAPAQAVVAASQATPAAASWIGRLVWDGDLRYRHEMIDEHGRSVRNRHRMRARANATATLNDDMEVGFGLATGGDNNDSANVSFDNAFSRKPVGIDLAYVDWKLAEPVTLLAGKMSNPFFRPGDSHLLFDGDLRPEGLAFKAGSGAFVATASAFWAEERSSASDTLWYGLQAMYQRSPAEGIALTAGASFHTLSNIKGRTPLFTPNNGQGNQLDANGNYLYGFSKVEVFGEARVELASHPLTLFVDYVTNTEADAFSDGFALGINYRRESPAGAWSLGYAFQDLEANAVVGAFTDSDFAGGASDGSGHTLRAGYVFPRGWRANLRYIFSERGEAAGNPRDYNRLQADLRFDF